MITLEHQDKVNEKILQVLDANIYTYIRYARDGSLTIDGDLTLHELKKIVEIIEDETRNHSDSKE